jgi:predicted AAA+ superfamily ATPase
MKRKFTKELLSWKKKRNRMPLLVYGARQVGKTYTIRKFGADYYKNVVYINLEINITVSSYFEENIQPERIIRFLETESKERIIPGETLIILDEIQSSERALTSLKYFNENAPEYHIIAAGSLLGVALRREKYSFPVGNVDMLTLFPFDFEEFLWARNEERLSENIKEAFDNNTPLPSALHSKALDLYREYLIIGGMPNAISEFSETRSLLSVPDVQQTIVSSYIADMAKYASETECIKIRAAYDSIPVQLAKENRKFQYKLAQKGGTAVIFGVAIDWLDSAGITLKCTRLTDAAMPLAVYQDLSSFKLYMGDTGLLTMRSGIHVQTVLAAGETDNIFLGALTENYVAQALTANRRNLFYYANDGKAEIDFVLQDGADIIPIEVKSGTHTRSRSLNEFIKKYNPPYAIRVSAKNFGSQNGIKSIPLYAVYLI